MRPNGPGEPDCVPATSPVAWTFATLHHLLANDFGSIMLLAIEAEALGYGAQPRQVVDVRADKRIMQGAV